MHLSTIISSSLALLANTVHGAMVYKVNVGANGLRFEPNNFTAEVGSFVEFTFFPKNHTITQSSFSAPCQPLNAPSSNSTFTLPQIHSGFIATSAPGPNPQTFTIKITDQKPLWLYCAQTTGSHCQSGMVMSINAPLTGSNTFANYLQLATNGSAKTTSLVPDGGIQGGVLAAAGQGTVGVSYTSTQVTVTSVLQTSVLSTYVGAQTTYTTEAQTVREVVVVVVTSWPVQAVATATQTVTQEVPATTSANATGSGGERVVLSRGGGLLGAVVGLFVWGMI